MGFKIDAVEARFTFPSKRAETKNIWLRLKTILLTIGGFASALPLVVWTLKRKVRAFGGCLGMHRR